MLLKIAIDYRGVIKLPKSLKAIGDRAFEGCAGFEGELVLPEDLSKIGEKAFHFCKGITGKLILPIALETIGSKAFEGTAITDVLVMNKTTKIAEDAFPQAISIHYEDC